MSAGGESLGSQSAAPIGPGDHVRGEPGAPAAILFLDLACPHCAADWQRVRELPLLLCVRHFPIAGKRPRAPALHAATEAAADLGGEDAFWQMWDSLVDDQAHSDDPHLWARAEAIGLDLERFEKIRRSDAVVARVRSAFIGGVRAGVVGTPSVFCAGWLIDGDIPRRLQAIARGA